MSSGIDLNCFLFRLIGNFRMILQELVEVGHVKISDSLLDTNNVVMKVCKKAIRV